MPTQEAIDAAPLPSRGSAMREPPPHWSELPREVASDDEVMENLLVVPLPETYLPPELANIKAGPQDAESADTGQDANIDEVVAKIQEMSEEIENNGLIIEKECYNMSLNEITDSPLKDVEAVGTGLDLSSEEMDVDIKDDGPKREKAEFNAEVNVEENIEENAEERTMLRTLVLR